MTEPCPSAETLSAYLRGTLSSAERAAVEKHVAACEDCFEQLAAAAAFRVEEEGSAAIADLSAARRPRRSWYVAIAAAVVALAVWGVVRQRATTVGAGGEMLALADGLGDVSQLRAAAAQAWTGGGGGLAFGGGLPARKRAFRLGVHLLDARVALAAEDPERWDDALDRIAALVPQGDATTALERLRAQANGEGGRSGRADGLERLTAASRRLDAQAFDLGAWAEAGRLAALGDRADELAPGSAPSWRKSASRSLPILPRRRPCTISPGCSPIGG